MSNCVVYTYCESPYLSPVFGKISLLLLEILAMIGFVFKSAYKISIVQKQSCSVHGVVKLSKVL